MAWLAVDKDGSEYIYSNEPIRDSVVWCKDIDKHGEDIGDMVELPNGSIYNLIGHNLTWEDKPVEI